MIDIFKVAAECLYRFKNNHGGIKSLCLQQPTSPGAVYALCSKILEMYKTLDDIVNKLLNKENTEYHQHLIVMIYEWAVNGLPNKRRKLSQQTRNVISTLKQLLTPQDIQNLNLPEQKPQEVKLSSFRVSNPAQNYSLLTEKLAQLRLQPTPTLFSNIVLVPPTPFNYLKDLGEFQSIGSCLPVLSLLSIKNISKCKSLLDLCAAPGSKSLQASEHFQVTANELDERRFRILQKRAQNKNISCINSDAFALLDTIKPNQYQIILLDPSCSSSGNENIDKKYSNIMNGTENKPDIDKLQEFQKRLLLKTLQKGYERNVKYVSYSTCSVYDQENEQVVEWVLEQINEKDQKIWKLISILDEEFEKQQEEQLGEQKLMRGLRNSEVVRYGEEGRGGFFVAVFGRV